MPWLPRWIRPAKKLPDCVETPGVLALMGLPGAGKSRLAQAMADSLGWVVLDRDLIRQQQSVPGESLQAGKQRAEAAMQARLKYHVRQRQNLILDGMTLATRCQRAFWRQCVEKAGGRWQLVFLDCPVALAVQRVSADTTHPAADRDAGLVVTVQARLQRPDSALVLDARLTTEALLAQLRQQRLFA